MLPAEWEAYNMHDIHNLAHVAWVGSVLYTDPAQRLITARWDVDDLLNVDRDMSHFIFSSTVVKGFGTVVFSPPSYRG